MILAAVLCSAFVCSPVYAAPREPLGPVVAPTIATLDADARASGNRRASATAIGRALFTTEWPAQVLNVYADGVGAHEVAGLRISGVKFHRRIGRLQFVAEVRSLIERTFAAAPVGEVDVWAQIPIPVRKGAVVSGDKAVPTSRNVFTITVRRGESASSMTERMLDGRNVYWDEEWAGSAFKVTR